MPIPNITKVHHKLPVNKDFLFFQYKYPSFETEYAFLEIEMVSELVSEPLWSMQSVLMRNRFIFILSEIEK